MSFRITRREALRSTAAAGLAAVAAPFALGRLTDKSGAAPIIVGAGGHTYEMQHDWGDLPAHIRFGNTHGVCEDAQGNIHIKHTVHASSSCDDAIVVFDSAGKFVRSWGKSFKGGAHGLHLSNENGREFLYLCDPQRSLVIKSDLDGHEVWSRSAPLESGHYNDASEYHPTNVAVAPGGAVFVADGYGKSWIHVYDQNGAYQRSFGGPGAERGQVSCPHGLMVDLRGATPLLLVADRSNRRVQRFTLEGRSLGFSGEHVRLPCHFHTRGDDLLIPDLEARVTILDKNNQLIAHLGDGTNYALRDKQRPEFIPGKFIAPHSAIFTRAGDIFVVEWVEIGRVTKLKRV